MNENPKKAQQRRQWEQMKSRPLKERAVYLATYYRGHALLALAAVAILVFAAVHMVAAKDTVLQVTFLNVWVQEGLDAETIGQEFLSFGGLNPKKQEIVLGGSLHPGSIDGMPIAEMQATSMGLIPREIDVLLTTDTWIRQNRDEGMFADLSEILPEELLEAYRDKIFYLNSTVDDKGEFPVGIDVSQSSLMLSPDLPAYFCVTYHAENRDSIALFLRYLLERPEDGEIR